MNVLLEILKLTLPSLVVFLTVFFVLREYLKHQRQIKLLEIKQDVTKTTLPLKLQAYERLSLFCERISIPSLILRLNSPGSSVQNLRHTMLVSIQKEFEHNITQQMYVSESLWKIIKLASDQTVDTINVLATRLDSKGPSEAFVEVYYKFMDEVKMDPLSTALSAMKQQAALILI